MTIILSIIRFLMWLSTIAVIIYRCDGIEEKIDKLLKKDKAESEV